LRVPHFLDNQLKDGGKIVSLTRRPLFTPQENYLKNKEIKKINMISFLELRKLILSPLRKNTMY
jgi:hypothetical protein